VCGFGVGGNLVNKKLIDKGDFASLTELARRFAAAARPEAAL
jgi:2-keto-3-deoxy-6-phosphogluconate aldolase